MVEIIRFPDAIAETIGYLAPFLPEDAEVALDVPPEWKWDRLLITVTDTGGPGERDVVLNDVYLTIEVSHPDSVTASDTAQDIWGLLRAWPGRQSGVYYRSTIMRPTYTSDEQTRTPSYAMTASITFRGKIGQVTSL